MYRRPAASTACSAARNISSPCSAIRPREEGVLPVQEKSPRTIVSSRLTTCEVDDSGTVIRLSLVDETGTPLSIDLSFEQAEAVVMTLPRLLSNAVKAQMQSADA